MQICVNYNSPIVLKKLYYLSTCSTCKRIINGLNLPSNIVRQDIKNRPITKQQLQELVQLSGNYEALFNKRSRLFLAQKKEGFQPDESAYKRLLGNFCACHYISKFVSDFLIVLGDIFPRLHGVSSHQKHSKCLFS